MRPPGIFLAHTIAIADYAMRREHMPRILTFKDELTIRQVAMGANSIREAIKERDEVVIDALDIKKTDVAAIQMFIATQKECEKNNQRITIKKSESVDTLLSLIGAQI